MANREFCSAILWLVREFGSRKARLGRTFGGDFCPFDRQKLDLGNLSGIDKSLPSFSPERRLLDWTMADKDDVLLNSREVAFLLDLSPDTVNEFARRNIIPAFKKGRQWRFRKRDIASVKRQLRGVNAAA